MTKEQEGMGSSGAGPSVAGGEPMALALALGGASAGKTDRYLDEHTALAGDQREQIRLQTEEMRQRNPYEVSHLRLRRFSDWAKAAFEFSAGLLALALAAGVAFLVWNAANSNQLVIDSFQAPPELAARGLSGAVVAAKLSDKIAVMQTQTTSQRAARSYANGLADGLKLEIPETGVSLSELDRFLRERLGHDLHIGGEMVQTASGITLTARVGSDSATVAGAQPDMDGLLQQLAEKIYRTTQPYRYGTWLNVQGRDAEAIAVYKQLAASGQPRERAWAYNGWAVIALQQDGERATLPLLQRGHELDPDNYLLIANLGATNMRQGRIEAAIRWYRLAQAALAAHGGDYTQPDRIVTLTHGYNATLLERQGALPEAAREQRATINSNLLGNGAGLASLAVILAQLHEPAAARAALAEYMASSVATNNNTILNAVRVGQVILAETQDWTAAPSLERDFAALLVKNPGLAGDRPTLLDPAMAVALAHQGRFAEAEARIAATPGDCYPCLRARAQVAALQGQPERADWWFARAAAIGPSQPYAQAEWGRALLGRRQPDTAIDHFTIAGKISPHFADPLEYWGEALMAKNQSHLALAKFAEAEKYAPNWGRLHLKWGEALVYAGKKDEAKAQFARAAQLDLTPSEKAELARHP